MLLFLSSHLYLMPFVFSSLTKHPFQKLLIQISLLTALVPLHLSLCHVPLVYMWLTLLP
jgi:hypothetical protein